jgi:hypothetical protein
VKSAKILYYRYLNRIRDSVIFKIYIILTMLERAQSVSLMELFIETLTGAAFEMKVHPADTIHDVKARIQKTEGEILAPKVIRYDY